MKRKPRAKKSGRRRPKPAGWHWSRKDPVIHPDGRKGCRFCTGPVPKGRHSFCSPACVGAWTFRTRNAVFRQVIYDRDRGVCALCGLRTDDMDLGRISKQRYYAERIEAQAGDKRELWRRWSPRVEVVVVKGVGVPYPADYWRGLYDRAMTWHAVNNVKPHESVWQVDHCVPVADSGPWWSLDNLATLCPPCHRAKTGRENRERAARRRGRKGD